MQEIFRTQDIVEISFVKSLLDGAGIRYFVFGEHLNAMVSGLVGDDISSCRFMVLDDDMDDALEILEVAGLFDDEEYNEEDE